MSNTRHALEEVFDGEFRLDDTLDSVPDTSEPPANVTPIQGAHKQPDRKYEKARHRIICYRTACGDTPTEIADQLDIHVETVRQILRTPRAKQQIAEIIADRFGNEVTDLIRGGTVDAVMEIRGLMQKSESDSVRLRAAQDMLDRAGYKPGAEVKQDDSPKTLLEQIKKGEDASNA